MLKIPVQTWQAPANRLFCTAMVTAPWKVFSNQNGSNHYLFTDNMIQLAQVSISGEKGENITICPMAMQNYQPQPPPLKPFNCRFLFFFGYLHSVRNSFCVYYTLVCVRGMLYTTPDVVFLQQNIIIPKSFLKLQLLDCPLFLERRYTLELYVLVFFKGRENILSMLCIFIQKPLFRQISNGHKHFDNFYYGPLFPTSY